MKRVIWGWILFTVILSIPSLAERVKVESNQSSYEVVVPYLDIEAMTKVGLSGDNIFRELKKANVQAISFEPLTLLDLQEKHLIQMHDKGQLLQLHYNDRDQFPEEEGLYIKLLERNHPLVSLIPNAIESNYENLINVQSIMIEDKEYLFVPYATKFTEIQPITFDVEALELITDYGFSIVARLKNDFHDQDDQHPLFQQLFQYRGDIDHLVFSGDKVVGYSLDNSARLQQMARRMNEWNMNVVLIENTHQLGTHELVKATGNVPIRLHSITLGKNNKDLSVAINRGTRAIQERNIQLLYVHLLQKEPLEVYHTPKEAQETLNQSTVFLNQVEQLSRKPAGRAVPMKQIDQPFWLNIIISFAAIGFVGMAVSQLHKRLVMPSIAITLCLLSLSLFLQHALLTQIMALIVAVITPVYAISSISKLQTNVQVIFTFLKVVGITLTGAWFIITTLYGWEYFVQLEKFRGVKILSIIPVTLVAFKLIGFRWLYKQVKFWHIFAVIFIFGLALFYIGRTGNHGLAIPLEMEFRQWLENTLGVRPRTKELIGFPLLVLSIYFIKEKYQFGKYVLLLGVIACSSIIGTFTHLHTPLLVSIHRSALSVAFGLVIGLILIGIWHVTKKRFYRLNKERQLTWKL